jgi:hypothetical protein
MAGIYYTVSLVFYPFTLPAHNTQRRRAAFSRTPARAEHRTETKEKKRILCIPPITPSPLGEVHFNHREHGENVSHRVKREKENSLYPSYNSFSSGRCAF